MIENKEYLLIEKVLSKTASPSEIKDLEKWIGESDENRKKFREIEKIWKKYDGIHTKRKFDPKDGLKEVAARLKIKNTRKKKTRIISFSISAAASILILLGLLLNFNNEWDNNLLSYQSTESAQEVLLDDGSKIWLNKNSSLKISNSFNKHKRRVLLTGEAYFEINRDEEKPFEVVSGNTITRVLGTSFNINNVANSNNVILTVASGKVGFKNKNALMYKTTLIKDQMAVYNAEYKTIKYGTNSNLNYQSWKSNYLVFQDTPLPDVCKQLSKHFNTRITPHISDSNLYLTGKYEGESLGEILNIIEITFNIHIDSTANEYSLHDVNMN